MVQSNITGQTSSWADYVWQFTANSVSGALPYALLYGLGGLCVAFVLSMYLARSGLIVRRPKLWHILAKTSYLAIFISFMITGSVWGGLSHIQSRIHMALETDLKPVVETQMPLLRERLFEYTKAYVPGKMLTVRDIVEPFVKQYYYQGKSNSFQERVKERIINSFLLRLGADTLTKLLQQALVSKIESLGAGLKVDYRGQAQGELVEFGTDLLIDFATGTAKEIDMTQLDKNVPQVFVDAVRKQSDKYFNSLYLSIGIFVATVLLAIIAEILIYFRWWQPKYAASFPAKQQ